MDFLVKHQVELSSLSFFWLLSAVALLEYIWPRRTNDPPPLRRWMTNAGLHIVNSMSLRFLVPVTGIGLAAICQQQGWGLFNIVAAPAWLIIVFSLLLIDFVGYLEHAVLHRVPLFWRFHKIHHADNAVDFSTTLRFHPLEAFLSTAVNFGVILMFGLPVYVIVLNMLIDILSGFFTHSNFALPQRADRWIRLFFITPDMHRVHHSTDVRETDSNYGVVLPWWDRIFGTYVAQPAKGHANMQLGLSEYRGAKLLTMPRMLWMPFMPPARAAAEPQQTTILT
jgi:sterol desaturase/sphingolipid hydroxylase (fatty acid hydroxylase superfamily)